MKNISFFTVVAVTVVLSGMAASSVLAEGQQFGAGVRVHAEHSEFEELPFEDEDLSYGAVYEYHAEDAYWQIACMYAPDPGGRAGIVDYVITPQLNLILKDKIWRGGLGILGSYIEFEDDAGDSDWTDVYWQFILGINVPFFFGMNVEAAAYYPFEDWNELSDMDTDDIEYGAWISHAF